jgi:hypothetical protein
VDQLPEHRPYFSARTLRRAAMGVILLLLACIPVWSVWKIGAHGEDYERPGASRFSADYSQELRDDAPIVGVTIAGRHRAYLLQALLPPDNHVYNDMLGDTPVTVTFCDIDNCVAVFTREGETKPLDIAVGGADPSRPKKMLLRVGSDRFWQDTGLPLDGNTAMPYSRITCERTTWGEWRAAHLDSDIYIGAVPVRVPNDEYKIAPPLDAP